ncbi:sensor domain-containing diguanylate cyclase [Citrifermentans bremense]|uniref:sensor domain-containing diguanylate cyclase n=1 Tax=Citrifermentans bremense TaxID=60035 RepID=UPI000428D01B|nr:diguanylate cyclase [Citrifermentans bremense]
MSRCSLKIKMSLVVFLLIGTVSSCVAGLGLLFFMREFKETVAARQFAVVSAMAGELDEKILAAQRELVAVAMSIPPATGRDAAALQSFLDQRLDLHQVFSDGTAFFSADGRLVAFSPGQSPNIGDNFSKLDFLAATFRSGKALISEPFPSQRRRGHQVVMFTVPVLGAGGRIIGVLGGRVDLMEENFLSRVAHLNLQDGREFFLFNRQRQIVAHRNHDQVGKPMLAKGKRQLLDRAIDGYQGSGEMDNPAGSPSIYSFKRLPTRGWILAAERPLSEAYAPIYRAQKLAICSLALLLPLALIIVWLFVGRLTAPLQLFAGRVREIGGDAAKYLPVPVSNNDEIGDLAQAFNAMMQELVINKRSLESEKGFAVQLLQHSAVPCFVIDAEHRVIIWNSAMEELTGVAAGAQLGLADPWRAFYDEPRRVLADIVVAGTLYEMADLYSCYADSPLIPEGLRAEGWYRLKGKQRYLAFEAAPIRDAEGRLIAAIQTMQDMTLRANNEEQLRGMVAAIGESEERFRRLVELSLDGIAILVGRRFVFVNPAGCEMLGYRSSDELLGKEMREFIQRDSEQQFLEQAACAEETGTTAPWIEERLLRHDRTAMEVELGVGPFVFRGENALQVIFRDITERKLAKARLETLAHYDSLTSLPNRVLFFDRLRHAVSEAKRYKHPLALMFLDLDSFKQVNDRLGHAAGDAVLVEAGYRLRECVRACDMVARMGGDEFTIILTKMADQRDASLVAERVLESFALPFLVEGESAQVGVSIGICVYPDCDADLDGMVRYADYAMYQAKQDGKNVYRFYVGG